MDILNYLENVNNLTFLGFNYWSYVVLFLFAFLEPIPIVGFFVPGMTAVIIFGFLAKLGEVSLLVVILITSLASILGDLSAYLIGSRYGFAWFLTHGERFFLSAKRLHTLRDLINNHLGKTLIFGRFNSMTRSFSAFVAGVSHAPFLRFMAFNFLGGTLWSISFVLLGYFLGHSIDILFGRMKNIGIWIFVFTIIFILFNYVLNKKAVSKE